MPRCALPLAATATVLAALDLGHKAASGGAVLHVRSDGYVALVVVLSIAWAAAIVLARSRALAVGGGVVLGGAVGNVASLALWPGVPNPLQIGWLAFNLADTFVLGGFVLVAATTLWLAATRPAEQLRLR